MRRLETRGNLLSNFFFLKINLSPWHKFTEEGIVIGVRSDISTELCSISSIKLKRSLGFFSIDVISFIPPSFREVNIYLVDAMFFTLEQSFSLPDLNIFSPSSFTSSSMLIKNNTKFGYYNHYLKFPVRVNFDVISESAPTR